MIDDPRLTPEMVATGKLKLKLIAEAFKNIIRMMLGDDFAFVVVIRHKTEAKTMLIVGDVDTQEEMADIITEAYNRHRDSECTSLTMTT